MNFSAIMVLIWLIRGALVCVFYNEIMAVSARYHYPEEPDIDFTIEKNHTCRHGCSICSDLRYVCTQLNVTKVPQTFPSTLEYLQLTDIPTVLDIQNSTFTHYTNLRYLDISRNQIRVISQVSLKGLRRLEYLKNSQPGIMIFDYYSTSSFLQDIENKALVDIKRLKYMDFRGNSKLGLNKIINRLLPMVHLNHTIDYLDLSFTNDIDGRSVAIQSYVLKIKRMKVFKRLKVKVLKLDGNHISYLEAGFGNCFMLLEYLSLSGNYLSLNFWNHGNIFYGLNFKLMYSLKVFDVGSNAHLPIQISHKDPPSYASHCLQLPINLEELYIDNMVISKEYHFDDAKFCIVSPNHLRVVHMPGAIFAGLHGPMFGLYNLTYLNMQNMKTMFTDPEAFSCKYWPKVKTLLLGNLNLETVYSKQNETVSMFQNCSAMESIDLENTKFAKPKFDTFSDLVNVRYINLSANGITFLNIDLRKNMNLTLLNVSSNLISHLTSFMMSQLDNITRQNQFQLVVDLDHNPLLCGCSQLDFIKWIKSSKVEFHNFKSYQCLKNSEYHFLDKLSIDEITLECQMMLIVSVSTSLCVMIILAIICKIVYIKRHRLEYLWLVSRQMARRLLGTQTKNDDYRVFNYHAFLSYSCKDDISVIVEIQKKMEEEFGLTLSIHDRDFVPGQLIVTNIVHFMETSRKVIVLMSNNFLESKWCNFEFDLSKNKRLDSTYDTMVMILLHDLKDLKKDKMSSSLKSYLGQKTYLKWPKDSSQNPAFWLRLKEALDFGDVQNANERTRQPDSSEGEIQDDNEGSIGQDGTNENAFCPNASMIQDGTDEAIQQRNTGRNTVIGKDTVHVMDTANASLFHKALDGSKGDAEFIQLNIDVVEAVDESDDDVSDTTPLL